MSNKQSGSDQIRGNGSTTAMYITQIKSGKQAEEDLIHLAEICFKGNIPLSLFASSKHKNFIPEELVNNGKIQFLDSSEFAEDIKNVCPIQLPLQTDVQPFTKWVISANKAFNGKNTVVANGVFTSKSSYFDKYLGYISNFWPKLFLGVNSNLSACEGLIMSKRDFQEVVFDKKINTPWQIASLADKSNQLTRFNFEYPKNSFVFGDGLKSAFKSKIGGFTSMFNYFIKSSKNESSSNNWSNINASIYKKSFGILASILLILMTWISFDYNITWDEPNHNTFSKDVLKFYTSLGNDTTMFDFQKAGHRDYVSNVYYGMSIDVFAAGINSIFSIKNEFATRHVINAIVGFFAILFAALVVRLFSGWLPALIALIAIICSPSFFGHCFNNPKDIPFATGYIMALYYLLKMMKEMPNAKHQTKVMLAISIGFALSIRAGGLLLFGFLLMGLGLQWLLFRNKKISISKTFKNSIVQLFIVAIGAYIVGIIMWPYALRQPLTGAVRALKEFEKFGFLTYYELFEGTRQYIKPWYYEIKLISITAPIAVLIGFGLSIILSWIKSSKIEKLMVFVLLIATAFPVVYAIYKQSYVYNGWRHFIFIYPSMLSLAILGWYWLTQTIKSKKAQTIILFVVCLTFVKPGIWSIANHPYQYMYFNELTGGVAGANGNYELDYWNQTPREAFKWLIENEPIVKTGKYKVSSNNIQESLKTFVPEGDSVKYAWTREFEWTNNDWAYAIWTSRTLSKNQILGKYWPPKGTIHEIKVDGVTVAVVVKAPNNYSYLAKQYLSKNKPDSALYFYEKCYAWNEYEEEYARGIGNACKALGKYDSAITFFNKAIALRDGNYDAFQGLADVYFTKAYMVNSQDPDKTLLEKAYTNYEFAYKCKKNSSSPLYMGEISFLQNKFVDAKTNFNLFLQTYGNAAQGYIGLAKSQLQLNESDSALYNLQVALQIDPKNAQAYFYLGTELQRLGRTKEAEQFLNEYRKLSGAPMQ